MADNEQTTVLTAEDYIRSYLPNANVNDTTMQSVLTDAGIPAGTAADNLSERQKDLGLAYLIIRIAFNPITSQSVTDKDGDWEHSEGSEQWSKSQLQQFLILARDLLKKYGLTDQRIESLAPKWDVKGTGFRYRRHRIH